ncbi:putative E3 ubiquitin-protein ligase RF4-like [Planoprotostelium fungivorum]|uniref:Putative E3 ubiquitin-protein ligase RF4-like n=1 Tax=Planoprotostelium fungivorum TaxID=1890364 RepID=A0A2P6N7U3_9EUKA|nr:putative E3 ubiquitin-protein ligase RF4-like [Planoprotostelium fungivorum]
MSARNHLAAVTGPYVMETHPVCSECPLCPPSSMLYSERSQLMLWEVLKIYLEEGRRKCEKKGRRKKDNLFWSQQSATFFSFVARTQHTHPMSSVIFNVNVRTLFGEQLNLDWDVHRAIPLQTDETGHSLWTTSLTLPSFQHIEYKYILMDRELGKAQWEPFQTNRRLYVTTPWTLVDDGRFGTLRDQKQIITCQDAAQYMMSPTPFQQLAEELRHRQEIATYKTIINDLQSKMEALETKLKVVEGTHIQSLSLNELRDLATRRRQIADEATEIVMEKMEAKVKTKREQQECVACMDYLVDTLILPCAHFVVCHKCAPKLGHRCPMCNTEIQSMHKVNGGRYSPSQRYFHHMVCCSSPQPTLMS